MKRIYIVLTYTGTLLSRAIKLYTKKKYAHVSIALEEDLESIYSFGRLNPYNPFIGGFVREGIHTGTFKRFKNTEAKVLDILVTDEQYEKICKEIRRIEKRRENYKFNILGLFAVLFNRKIQKKNQFYCAEFVKYVLARSQVSKDLPKIIRPDDFLKIKYNHLVYEGLLQKYQVA